MEPMRKVGLVMVVPGILLLVIMIVPFFLKDTLPRDGLPWTYTWASVLGMFFFFAGLALLWVTGGIGIRKNSKSRRN